MILKNEVACIFFFFWLLHKSTSWTYEIIYNATNFCPGDDCVAKQKITLCTWPFGYLLCELLYTFLVPYDVYGSFPPFYCEFPHSYQNGVIAECLLGATNRIIQRVISYWYNFFSLYGINLRKESVFSPWKNFGEVAEFLSKNSFSWINTFVRQKPAIGSLQSAISSVSGVLLCLNKKKPIFEAVEPCFFLNGERQRRQ